MVCIYLLSIRFYVYKRNKLRGTVPKLKGTYCFRAEYGEGENMSWIRQCGQHSQQHKDKEKKKIWRFKYEELIW